MKITFSMNNEPAKPKYPDWINPCIQEVLNQTSNGLINWHQINREEYKKYSICPVYVGHSGVYYEKGGRKGIQAETYYPVNTSRFRTSLPEPGVNYLFYNKAIYGPDKEVVIALFPLPNQSQDYLIQTGKGLALGRLTQQHLS